MGVFKAVQVVLAQTGGKPRLEEVSGLGQHRALRKPELDSAGDPWPSTSLVEIVETTQKPLKT